MSRGTREYAAFAFLAVSTLDAPSADADPPMTKTRMSR